MGMSQNQKCLDDCDASSETHCWNKSDWISNIVDSPCTLNDPDAVPDVGDVVIFNDCIGYIDSLDTAASGESVANVVALRRKPGEWLKFGNPSIKAMCYRVPLQQLQKMVVRTALK